MNSMQMLGFVLGMGLFIAGCETAENIKVGATTPLAPGEMSAFSKAKEDAAPFSGLPWGIPAVATAIFGLYRLNERGRNIKIGKIGTSPQPVTGWLGKVSNIEPIIQTIGNVFAGAYEVGPDGSVQKRGWKVLLSALLPAILLLVPNVREWVVANANTINKVITNVTLYLGGGTLALLGAEKGLSIIKPVQPPTPSVHP